MSKNLKGREIIGAQISEFGLVLTGARCPSKPQGCVLHFDNIKEINELIKKLKDWKSAFQYMKKKEEDECQSKKN